MCSYSQDDIFTNFTKNVAFCENVIVNIMKSSAFENKIMNTVEVVDL